MVLIFLVLGVLWKCSISSNNSPEGEIDQAEPITDLPFIQILSESFRFFFCLNLEAISIYKCYFGSQIQILFCIFNFFSTFIQILYQIKVAGLLSVAKIKSFLSILHPKKRVYILGVLEIRSEKPRESLITVTAAILSIKSTQA